MKPKTYSIIISSVLIASMAVSIFIARHQAAGRPEKEFRNPLFEEFNAIGKKYGIDVSFARTVKNARYGSLLSRTFLSKPKQYYDVIIIGDSSISWGLIPQAVEQMTGLKTGMVAYESLTLTDDVIKASSVIARHFLKQEGMLIFAFMSRNLTGDPSKSLGFFQSPMSFIAGMSESGFEEYVKSELEKNSELRLSVDTLFNFESYRRLYDNARSGLRDMLSMPEINIYQRKIEKRINPKWHSKKSRFDEDRKNFIRWDDQAVTMYKEKIEQQSIRSETPANPGYKNKNAQTLADGVKKIPFRKRFMIHISRDDAEYVRLRSIYNACYSGSCALIDLGRLHPRDASFPVIHDSHTVNTGGIYQSILLAEWLKKNERKP